MPLVVGDLFDHGRVPEDMVQAAFDVLAKLDVPTVLISGNHDIHDDASLYRRHEPVVGGAGVTFIDEVEATRCACWTASSSSGAGPWTTITPASGHCTASPAGPRDSWYVVLGHGHYIGQEPADASMRSSPITDDDIAATDADYVALGHWHADRRVGRWGAGLVRRLADDVVVGRRGPARRPRPRPGRGRAPARRSASHRLRLSLPLASRPHWPVRCGLGWAHREETGSRSVDERAAMSGGRSFEMSWLPEIEELHQRRAFAAEMGGAERVAASGRPGS